MQPSIPTAIILQMGRDEVLESEVAAPGSPCTTGQSEGERHYFVTSGPPRFSHFHSPGLGPTAPTLVPPSRSSSGLRVLKLGPRSRGDSGTLLRSTSRALRLWEVFAKGVRCARFRRKGRQHSSCSLEGVCDLRDLRSPGWESWVSSGLFIIPQAALCQR